MNDEFVKNALANGKKGEEWLKQIPEKIRFFEEKWSLHVLPPYPLSYNYVAPVIRKDKTKAVLKIGMLWDREFFTEINALQLFNGQGITKLFDVDEGNAVMLIEKIEPGKPLSTLEDDNKATRILASTMKTIWKDLPKNHSFITIFQWTHELQEYVKSNNNWPIPWSIAKEAVVLFDELISSSKISVLTHGDLHHDNVLSAQEDNWLAIDPKGIAAEPLYDTAALIRNPYRKLKILNDKSLDALLTNRILILSKELSANPRRIYKWCLAQTTLSGVWTRDNKEYTDYALKIIYSLKRVKL